jgi:MFS family permease
MPTSPSWSLLQRRPSFRRLLIARLTSVLGDGVHTVTTMWLVQQLTGSAEAMGAVMIAFTVPQLAFSLLGGVSVDRYDRKAIMIAADLVRAAGVLLLALLAAAGRVQVWQIAAFAALNGAAGAFFRPSVQAVIPSAVEPEELQSANALSSMNGTLANISGTALGGLVLLRFGPAGGYAVDAASYLVSAMVLSQLRVPAPAELRGASLRPGFRGVWADLRAGIAYLLSQPGLLALVALTMGMVLAGISVPLLVGSYGQRALGLTDPALTAWLWSATTAGMFLGSLFLNAVYRVPNRVGAIFVAVTLYSLGFLGLSLTPPYPAAVLIMVAMGMCMAAMTVLSTALYQALVPRELLGRFFANIGLLNEGLLPLTMWITGLAADGLGPARTFGVIGGLLALGALLWMPLYPRVQQAAAA